MFTFFIFSILAIQQSDQRINRMEQQLKDLRAAAMGATPEALLQKIEEETKVNTYIVMQKLPKEIDTKRKTVENLQKVIDQPALGHDDINSLKEKIKEARNEIEELTSKKNVSNDPMEDKLTLFRQRVSQFNGKRIFSLSSFPFSFSDTIKKITTHHG